MTNLKNLEIPNESQLLLSITPKEKRKELNNHFLNIKASPENLISIDLEIMPVISFISPEMKESLESEILRSKDSEIEDPNEEKSASIFRTIKTEFYEFVCLEKEEHQKTKKILSGPFDTAVSVISNLIASILQISEEIVIATIAFLMKVFLQVGKDAWCKYNS